MSLYFRLLLTIIFAYLKPNVSMHKSLILQKKMVWPHDVNHDGRMNKGRCMTLLDLAILESLVRSGFLKVVLSLKATIVLGGAQLKFLAPLKIFEIYTLKMQYLGESSNWHVFEYAFVNSKGVVCVEGLLKGGVVKRKQGLVKADVILNAFKKIDPSIVAYPLLPQYALDWLETEKMLNDK